jgi:hypothetical protein
MTKLHMTSSSAKIGTDHPTNPSKAQDQAMQLPAKNN